MKMPRTTMTKYKAEQILELKGGYFKETVIKRYREKAVTAHPDAGGTEEAMIELNQAKDYLVSLFTEERTYVECSTEETVDQSDFDQSAVWEAVSEMRDFVRKCYAENGSENDAPFSDCEYTSKPQAEWTDEDWRAFISFQPPKSYENAEYFTEKLKSWDVPLSPTSMTAGTPDVSSWKDKDWYFYWFTNARHPLKNGNVWVRIATPACWGPEAEAQRAREVANRKSSDGKLKKTYLETLEAIKSASYVGTFGYQKVKTPYGFADASKAATWSRIGNVGVPYAYAMADYDGWLELNQEAQREAKDSEERYRKKKRGKRNNSVSTASEGVVADVYGYTGAEFDTVNTEEDKQYIYHDDIRVPDFVRSLREELIEEGKREKAEQEAARAKEKAEQERAQAEREAADPAACWRKRVVKAQSAPYRDMGICEDADAKRTGNGKRYYNRNKIDNAPGWYNGLNAVLNNIPWRVCFWALIAAWLVNVWLGDPENLLYPGVVLIGLIFGAINSFTSYFSNWVRGLCRGLLDGALKIWAKATKTTIDWVAARDIAE